MSATTAADRMTTISLTPPSTPRLPLHAAIPATKAALMHIDKAQIIEVLRSRGLHDRADWVDRELPGVVDTNKNSSLLRMLQIDPAAIERTGG